MIYGILDIITGDYIGNLIILRHDKAAMRIFADAAEDKTSPIAKRPADYQLIRLAVLLDTGDVENQNICILTGEQWAGTQQQQETITPIKREA